MECSSLLMSDMRDAMSFSVEAGRSWLMCLTLRV